LPCAEVEKYDAQEVRSFLKRWGEARGQELSGLADMYDSGEKLCECPSFVMGTIYAGGDKALGEEL
jgi:hypothetical protein